MRNPSSGSMWPKIFRTTIFFTCVICLLVLSTAEIHAQCRPLTSDVCVDTVGVFSDFSFSQIASFWTIVAVTPQSTDDKDIAVYSSCASGSILATSTGTSGTDFIVGDFNHNAAGTFYPETSYGSQTDPYTLEWVTGGDILPISVFGNSNLGFPGAACPIVRIWDVYLEQDVEYRVDFIALGPPYGFLSLFRNPGSTEFWGGRSESEWEIDGDTPPFIYIPPATDWYGVVAFSDEPLTNWTPVGVRFEELNDCVSLQPDACVITHLYSVASGPSSDYAITPISSAWMAMAVTCQYVDDKCLELYTECDKEGTPLAHSDNSYTEITEVIVGDLRYASTATVYPAVGCGDVGDDYMFQWAEGPAELPLGAPGVFGTINTTTTDSDIIDVYDLSLDAGVDYRLKFMESGTADVQVALFANHASAEYWQGRDNGVWEISDPTDSYVFTAPVGDICGLVVFGDAINGSSTYSLEIERYDDCTPLPSEACVTAVGSPLDFSFDAGGYWAAVGVVPSYGDDKDINVFTGCDGEGTYLAGSEYIFGADFVVGDFNHVAAGTYNARITFGDTEALYSFDSDRGISASEDMFPLNMMVEGELGNFGIDCRQLRIWDVFLEAGETYQIGLTRSGQSDIHVALFYNPGNGAYWVGRANSEWETPAHATFNYSPPASDWYGLIAFSNKREGAGTYTIRIDHVGTGTGVDPEPIVPEKFALYQNAPNPFNPSTVIRFDVPTGGASVSLRIFDVNGRLVKTLVNEALSPGEKSATWHGDDDRGNRVASGVYFYSIETPGFRETRKLVLMK